MARVHVFRIVADDAAPWLGPAHAMTSIAFAWFVFNRNHSGQAIIDRISHGAPRRGSSAPAQSPGSTLFDYEYAGVRYVATASESADGRWAELFIDYARPNSQLAEFAQAAAILTSLLLQHGVTVAEIRRSVNGPVAHTLALMEREP